jgi:AcrR family transcriptional regulator
VPRAVDSEERRAELARAAARVIARDGIVGASLREVAAEAGLTTGALTHHFTDKRELLRFTLRASLEHRRATGPAPDDPGEALRSALEAALPLSEEARLHWIVTVAFCAQASGDADLATEQRDAYRRYRGAVAALVSRAAAAGRLDAGLDPVATAERLIAVVDGVALQALFDPDSWPPGRQVAVLDAALEPLRL